MDFNSTIDLIIKDLDEAREIIDDLKKYPGVPALQVELAKSKCKSAGEVIALLKSLKEEPVKPKLQPLVQEEKKALVKPERITAPAEVKKEVKITSEVSVPVTENDEESKITLKKESESTILADKFSNLTSSFNEQLGSLKSEDAVSEILKTKPLTNLSEAIGVNDKFLYIREIFDGNQDAYIQAISRLNSSESIADARAVIMSYTGDNNENEAVKQLLELVKRKLPSDE
jgi:hypothetical protein